MNLIRVLHVFASMAITSNNANNAKSTGTCVIEGIYNPTKTNKALQDCMTVKFNYLRVLAKHQLNLTTLRPGQDIQFNGNITFDVRHNQEKLLHIKGSKVTISASGNAWFDANGPQYWDGEGCESKIIKPMFAMIEVQDSILDGLKVRNTPIHAYLIACSNHSTFKNFKVDDSEGNLNPNKKAANTDGIHILQSNHINIQGAVINNQDDAVVIASGYDVNITDITSIGGGLSVGSIGKNKNANEVRNIRFSQSTITDSLYGVLIKTSIGGKGNVDGITFEDITLKDIKMFGIAVTQGFTGADITGTPTDGVTITNIFLTKVTGNVVPKAQNVLISCGSPTSCTHFQWSGVTVTGGVNKIPNKNAPPGLGLPRK